jgi:5'-methylthioadenosine/S-adenosylhomocysteine nucleosidase
MIGIIGALDEEINAFLDHLENKKETKWNGFTFFEGEILGKKVVLVKSGIGKVFASLVCQKLIDTYAPEKIIFTGVAGSLNNELEIGDVVVGKDAVQHDLDGAYLGAKLGQIPYTDYRFFKADEKLVKIALEAIPEGHKIISGRVLTGDQFITQKEKSEKQKIFEELEGDCIEMEGASVGQVCTINNIPFVIIRSISDKADGSDARDFDKFKHIAAENSSKVVLRILEKIDN